MQEFIWSEHGTCRNPERISAETKKVSAVIRYAAYEGKWGFGLDLLDDTEGYYCGKGKAVWSEACIFSSQYEAIRAGLGAIASIWKGKEHPEIRRVISQLRDKIRQEENTQLCLF